MWSLEKAREMLKFKYPRSVRRVQGMSTINILLSFKQIPLCLQNTEDQNASKLKNAPLLIGMF